MTIVAGMTVWWWYHSYDRPERALVQQLDSAALGLWWARSPAFGDRPFLLDEQDMFATKQDCERAQALRVLVSMP